MTSRRTGNQPLRELLGAAGWTYEALARAVNALGAENGVQLRYDRTAVAHWLTGSLPRPRSRELIAEAFTRRLRRPVTQTDLGMGEVPPDPVASPPHLGAGEAKPDAVTSLTILLSMDADPVRRPHLHQSIYRAAALDPTQWAHRGASLSPGRSAQAVPPGAEHLEDIETAVDFFHLAGNHGGRYARTALIAYLQDDVVPRLHASLPGNTRRRLLAQTCNLARELAEMYVDDVRDGVAQHYYRTAFQLAHEADDRVASAVLLGRISAQALDLGHCRAALRLAEEAVRTAPAASAPEVHATLHSHLARAQALAGDRSQARVSLSAAERYQPRDGRAGGMSPQQPYGCSRASVTRLRGQTLVALGEHAAALHALSLSVRHHPATAYLPRALTHAEVARLLLGAGHLEDACAAWHRFLDDYAHLRSGRADRVVVELRGRLGAHAQRGPVSALLRRACLAAGQRR